jgi:hypothetical protein
LQEICEAALHDFSAIWCSLVSLFTELQGVEQLVSCYKYCLQR